MAEPDGDDAVDGRPAEGHRQRALHRGDQVEAVAVLLGGGATPSLKSEKNGFKKMTAQGLGVSRPRV